MNPKLFIFSILLFSICANINTQTINLETDQATQMKQVVDTYVRQNLPDDATKQLFEAA